MKKIFKFLVVLVVFLFSINVKAEEEYSIVIKNEELNHTYEAYQIFTGDLSIDNKTLSNIVWGNGIDNSFTNLTAKEYAESITSSNAREKAKELGSHLLEVAGTTNEQADGKYTISGLTKGYYLIKDKDNTLNGLNDSYTEYIVRLVSNIEVKPKSDIPIVDKKIVEKSDVVYSTNYKLGDSITYKLTGTLPSNYDNYKSYKYIFHDKLSSGLTLNQDSIEVFIDNEKINNGYNTLVTNVNNETLLDIIFEDTKLVNTINKTSVIKVVYSALLNENAKKGSFGNINSVTLEYSNNPYKDETGLTPELVTKVYLFDLIFNKLDSSSNAPLVGAGFKLEKLEEDDYIEIDTIINDTDNKFRFNGLSTGKYKLTEIKTPDGYHTMNPIEFEITSEIDENGIKAFSGDTLSFISSLDEGTLTTDILNIKGVELPLTGGSGTTLFTILGISLILLSIIGFVINKKNN